MYVPRVCSLTEDFPLLRCLLVVHHSTPTPNKLFPPFHKMSEILKGEWMGDRKWISHYNNTDSTLCRSPLQVHDNVTFLNRVPRQSSPRPGTALSPLLPSQFFEICSPRVGCVKSVTSPSNYFATFRTLCPFSGSTALPQSISVSI